MNTKIVTLRPFVPSGKDFELARRFFAALGFEEEWSSDDLVILRFGPVSFFLQKYDCEEWQKNQMLSVQVEDLDVFWSEIEPLDLPTQFPGVRVAAPREYPWGREVNIVDPAGVCWHIQQK